MKRSGASRCSNVATSQHRDVGSTNTTVNKQQRRDVATSQRRDVETSRRQREICPPSLKAAKGSEFGASGGVRKRARNSRAGVTPKSKKCP